MVVNYALSCVSVSGVELEFEDEIGVGGEGGLGRGFAGCLAALEA